MFTLAVSTEDAMMVKGPPQGHWTASDWEQLDHGDGTRCEIIEGVLYVSKSPSSFHQRILARLFGFVGNPAYDYTEVKLLAFARAGVPEYAIIDPETRTLRYHRHVHEGEYARAVVFGGIDAFAFRCLPQFAFIIGDLFAGMPGAD